MMIIYGIAPGVKSFGAKFERKIFQIFPSPCKRI